MEKLGYIIDRIEENYAVCETYDGLMVEIEGHKIYGNFKEGDVLIKEGDSFKVSEELTKERREKIENIIKNMWQ